MTSQTTCGLPLFETRKYPNHPGSKVNGTSKEAADIIDGVAQNLRGQCLLALIGNELTADEIANRLGKSILSVRPRISELVALGKVTDTGKRRGNESGMSANVWKLNLSADVTNTNAHAEKTKNNG